MLQLHYDIIIVGAGISGIGNAYWLRKKCPDKTIAILEARETIGGTWSLFNYPGVRSDSDMFTFGYRFKPWTDAQPLSSGDNIKKYLKETVEENRLDQFIHFKHKMTACNWSSKDQQWELQVENENCTFQVTCQFLSICTGYYNYKKAYRPPFKGEETFKGQIIQPQFWPKDLDYQGKRVAVVGSGATAVTLVPSMAQQGAGHVTMVQRSPTYVVTLPNMTGSYITMQKWMPLKWAFKLTRIKNILFQVVSFNLSMLFPKFMKNFFMKLAAKQLPEGYPVDKHFNPRYNPWKERLCVVPDGDLFKAISSGKASVATGQIKEFQASGIAMDDGTQIEADIIVLATGLKMQLLGGASIAVDGKPFTIAEAMVYKGMMISGLPNFTYSFGYTNASWTLKVDLTANYLCKLVNYMAANQYKSVTPVAPANIAKTDFLDLSSGYIKRAESLLPKNGTKKPWRVYQNYIMDMLNIRFSKVRNEYLSFR